MTSPNAQVAELMRTICPDMEPEMARRIADLSIHATEECLKTFERITLTAPVDIMALTAISSLQLIKGAVERELEFFGDLIKNT